MFQIFIVLIVLVAILMCFIVLIQNSKGGGLSSGFASSNQIMGVRKTTDFLEKATWTLAAAMVVLSIFAAHSLNSGKETAAPAGTVHERMEESYKGILDAAASTANDAQAPITTPVE